MPQKTRADIPAEYREAVGSAVAALRRRRKWTGDQLGFAAGIHPATVRQVEGDGRASLAILHALARALGTTPARLLGAAEKNLKKIRTGD